MQIEAHATYYKWNGSDSHSNYHFVIVCVESWGLRTQVFSSDRNSMRAKVLGILQDLAFSVCQLQILIGQIEHEDILLAWVGHKICHDRICRVYEPVIEFTRRVSYIDRIHGEIRTAQKRAYNGCEQPD